MKTTIANTIATLATFATLGQGLSLGKRATTVPNVQYTFYGWPDNDPPGPATAYDCGSGRGYKAGGTGTYADPLTFATAPGEFTKCEIVWSPYLKKYLRFDDTCEQCTTDWKSKKYHVDIWTGSNTQGGGDSQIDCEDELTPDNKLTVVRSPPKTNAVNTGILYSASSGCHPENVFP